MILTSWDIQVWLLRHWFPFNSRPYLLGKSGYYAGLGPNVVGPTVAGRPGRQVGWCKQVKFQNRAMVGEDESRLREVDFSVHRYLAYKDPCYPPEV